MKGVLTLLLAILAAVYLGGCESAHSTSHVNSPEIRSQESGFICYSKQVEDPLVQERLREKEFYLLVIKRNTEVMQRAGRRMEELVHENASCAKEITRINGELDRTNMRVSELEIQNNALLQENDILRQNYSALQELGL